ncbi:MAG: pyruvate, phosphate dikinase [Candidatus Diapherotrites archaeon CG10_big_fil_rev_8_21_14_0_10_31_34]|nr:MAG: pyruvate, phosphate dikinase [Candidatus Diapherotrites archaeon CG10_big_fil_rev_8_21_14_0_10_31_34]
MNLFGGIRLKYVYFFEEGSKEMKNLLGGKGSNLCEMANLGLPVPKGFVISTEACIKFFDSNDFPEGLEQEINSALQKLEERTGKKFDSTENPLLVSVRSGARVSMPGMMDTVLNLGLNEKTIFAMTEKTQNKRFVLDSFRRFIQMFSNVVLGLNHDDFEEILEKEKSFSGVKFDFELTESSLEKIIIQYKALVEKETKKPFPENPKEQLLLSVKAVFSSWNNKRAITYRKLNNIPDDWGTGVIVQEMVFGNLGNDSGTGVCFTRNPSDGTKGLYGEFLLNAQGEDVVAGIRTPKKISELTDVMPEIFEQLSSFAVNLEKHYKDMQDMEFTIEKNKLFVLQTRNGKRTSSAAIRIAVEMVEENLFSKTDALMKIDSVHLNQLLHKRIDAHQELTEIASGLNASPGAATGKIVFDANKAESFGETENIILVRTETSPDDIHGMIGSKGILTARGGMTSHAAVVARGMGKPCVAGCEEIKIDYKTREMHVKDLTLKEMDFISIDGTTGKVFLGEVKLIDPKPDEFFSRILEWADEIKLLGVRTNADTPKDARKARELGAQGIGLCRTEHMFFEPERLPIMQKMILSDSTQERKKYLNQLEAMQRTDFEGILEAMNSLPVTIRLIDPPLHEFLPSREDLIERITELKNLVDSRDDSKLIAELNEKKFLLKKVNELHESNPMLGFRGCRLGIVYPEIIEMQTKAIAEAAKNLKEKGLNPKPEIMVPLVGIAKELELSRKIIEKVLNEIIPNEKILIGTMIELPRAALIADEIALHADFFSFGTNDLTQTTFGFSRDDVEGKFLNKYIEQKILLISPFVSLDTKGVGKLMETAVALAKKSKPNLKIGICGEHGGDPDSIEFCHSLGLNYVSCSPFRVPIARLAAAQAVIRKKQ